MTKVEGRDMTEKQAMRWASKRARDTRDERYVVYEPGYPNDPNGYHVASAFDLDTFFFGLEPIAAFDLGGNYIFNGS